MFGLSFLSRKLGATSSSSGTTGPVSTSPDVPSLEAEPPVTPSPPPQDLITDPNPLHALITSVPAQTLHSYTLANILPPSEPLSPLSFPHIPLPSDPPSPRTLTSLTKFFASLVPPPRLHCVRCHKSYFEVENTDRSCLVPHDDESAEVERVGASSRSKGIETEYETLWGCCGKTVEGDGDMGPPDGWCYEGKHTTDIKRARFRADSTPQDDKLTSCERLRCHQPHSPSPRVSRGRAGKRRRAVMEGEPDNEDTQSSAGGSVVSGTPSSNMPVDDAPTTRSRKRARHSKSASMSSSVDADKPKKGDDDVTMMDVEGTTTIQSQPQVPATPNSPPRPRKPRRKSAGGGPTTPGVRAKAKAKSPLASSFTPPSPPSEDDMQVREMAPPPLPRAIVQITTERDGSPKLTKPNSRSNLRKPSSASLKEEYSADSDTQPDKKKPKPKTRARRSTTGGSAPKTPKPASKKMSVESPDDSTLAAGKPKSSSTALKPKCSVTSPKSATRVKPPSTTSAESTVQKPLSKTGSVRKKRGKALAEVVATSIDGEEL